MGSSSPELKFQGTLKVKRDLDGLWIIGRLEVKKTKTRAALTGMFLLGTDGKQILSSTIDNMGNAGLTFGAFTDPVSITTIGEGTAMGAKVKLRDHAEEE